MNTPLLKLDIKYNLPMFNGEVNDKKQDDWVQQIEVYCRIQKLARYEAKIQQASLRHGGTTLIWWKRKNQEDLIVKGEDLIAA